MDKKYPVFFSRKEDCCGCTACYAVCPQGVIEMMKDEEGFDYPILKDEAKCIRCYRCLTVCPIKSKRTSL